LEFAADPTAGPLLERLKVGVTIDDDLIAHVNVESSLAQDRRAIELHEVEFGLALGAVA
jgi:molecular chaperone DnaK